MLGHLEPEDLIECGLWEEDSSSLLASTELEVHRQIYLNTDSMAVIHAHNPYTVALSMIEDEITAIDAEGIFTIKSIKVLELEIPAGASEAAIKVPPVLKNYPVVCIRSHGVFAKGSTLEDALQNGVLAGYPLIDIKAALVDGSYHDVDSSEMAFKIAASMALKNAVSKCNPAILEPMMKVEVVIPDEYLGDIMGDVTSRRGRVEGMEARGNAQVVRAFVPLSEMFGYATALRSNTQGRGTYSMHFDHYEEVPKSISEEIIKKNKGE